MKRALRVWPVVLGVIVACGLAPGAGASPSADRVPVDTSQNGILGTILVNASGRTLYHDGAERKHAVACSGSCAAKWLPLIVPTGAKPVAGRGVTASLLGTVKRPDGRLQVTYHGLALYLYAGDARAGDVHGQGSAGLWHAVAPTGQVVAKALPKPNQPTGSTSGSNSGSSTTPSSGSNVVTGSGYGTSTDPCVANPNGPGCGM